MTSKDYIKFADRVVEVCIIRGEDYAENLAREFIAILSSYPNFGFQKFHSYIARRLEKHYGRTWPPMAA